MVTTKEQALKECNLNDIVSSLLPLLRAEALQDRHDVVFHPGNISLRDFVDASEIRQVILNLVRNGLEAMSEIQEKLESLHVYAERRCSNGNQRLGMQYTPEITHKLGNFPYKPRKTILAWDCISPSKILDGYHADVKVRSSNSTGTVFSVHFSHLRIGECIITT